MTSHFKNKIRIEETQWPDRYSLFLPTNTKQPAAFMTKEELWDLLEEIADIFKDDDGFEFGP